MSQSRKTKVTVRIYHQFALTREQAKPWQMTLEEAKKYLSGKPLRRGPERQRGNDVGQTNPRSDSERQSDSGTP